MDQNKKAQAQTKAVAMPDNTALIASASALFLIAATMVTAQQTAPAPAAPAAVIDTLDIGQP